MSDWLIFLVFLEKKIESGNCSIQIGRLLLEQGCWGEAAMAFNNGIEKGNLHNSKEALALLAQCHRTMGNADYERTVASPAN